ncbi:MAG: ECF transporter S component, partial [Anaerolineae bacterium]
MEKGFTVRKIVVSGVLGAIAILLGATRLGFIPVPTAAGNATIMHVPAISGGIMEGWGGGGGSGGLFGRVRFLQATVPL